MSENITRLFELYLKLSDETAGLAGYAANLDIFWDGDANSAYVQTIGEDLVKMGVIVMNIKKTAGCTRRALNIYMRYEAEVSRIIRDINENVRIIGR